MDMRSEAFLNDPYPAYARMREKAGGVWYACPNRLGTGGLWLIARYDEVCRVLRESTLVSKDSARLIPEARRTPVDYSMLGRDPPDHRRLRDLAAPVFGTDRVAELSGLIEREVDRLVEELLSGEQSDFVDDFAPPLPLLVVCAVIGLPLEDAQTLRGWNNDLMAEFDSVLSDSEVQRRQRRAATALSEYFGQKLQEKTPRPGSILEALATDSSSSPQRDREAMGLLFLLLAAGYETTVNLLANGLFTLLGHPEQMELLRRDPGLLDSAVDEILRYESPLQRATFRVTRAPFEVGGRVIEPGQQLSVVLASANRDERQFDEAARFDIRRRPNRHLAFGLGIQRCLGERLARLEARIVFGRLLERTSTLELTGAPGWRAMTMFRGLNSLPIVARG
jgi:cytochrome P450